MALWLPMTIWSSTDNTTVVWAIEGSRLKLELTMTSDMDPLSRGSSLNSTSLLVSSTTSMLLLIIAKSASP